MILVETISLIVVQIETPRHEESIPENLLESSELTGDAAGETDACVHAKLPYLVMKSYAPFTKRQIKIRNEIL